jgi:hypothetical protein
MTEFMGWIWLFFAACVFAMIAALVYGKYATLRKEIDYMKRQLSTLQDKSHQNWRDIRRVSKAAGLKWVPKEEGKWVKE